MASPKELCEIARSLSRDLTLKDRILMGYRPRICPFHDLVEFVEPGSSVMDIGCGSGLWLFLLARLNLISSGLGLEVRPEKIAIANSLKQDDDPLEFIAQSPEAKWPLKTADCLSMIDVLHHVPPPRAKEIYPADSSDSGPTNHFQGY